MFPLHESKLFPRKSFWRSSNEADGSHTTSAKYRLLTAGDSCEMVIVIFLGSVGFLLFVARKQRIPLLSPYGVFTAFQVLYNLVPAIVSRLDSGFTLSLLLDTSAVNTQVSLAASANVCFGIIHWRYYQKSIFSSPANPAVNEHAGRHYILWSFPFFLITCYVAIKYGWNAQAHAVSAIGGQPVGGVYALASYVKSGFVAVYLYYIYRFGLNKWAWLLLGFHAIVAFLDGARTTFLPILLLTLFLLGEQSGNAIKRRKVYALAALGILISIGARAVIIRSDSFLARMITPVTVEGLMGSYPSLQSIYALKQEQHPNLTLGASYVVDPIVWFLPQGETRDRFLFLQSWVKDSPALLQEEFAPMGGFYYIAEAVTAFSYAGPAIVTTAFAFALIWVQRNANRHRLLYVTWMPTIGVLFVKMIFGNVFKLFLVDLVFVGSFVLVRHARLFLGKYTHRAGPLSDSQMNRAEEPA